MSENDVIEKSDLQHADELILMLERTLKDCKETFECIIRTCRGEDACDLETYCLQSLGKINAAMPPTTRSDAMASEELIKRLNDQAEEIAEAGHNGWGNTMTLAAERIAELESPTPTEPNDR